MLPAYALKMIFSRGTLKYYYFKAVRKWAFYYLDKLTNEAKGNRQTLDEDQLKAQALLLAKSMVQKAMRNEW